MKHQPQSETVADNASVDVAEVIVTNRPPISVVSDLQSSFA